MPFFLDHELHPFFKKNPTARKKFIGLVGCSNKRTFHKSCKARDMYRGALARMSMKWAERNCERWFIISPKYHLLEPEGIIEPYKDRLKDMDADDLLAWAQVVTEQAKCRVGLNTPFVLLGGSEYADALDLPKKNQLHPEFRLYDPCPKLQMGLRMNWIRSHPVMSKETVQLIKSGGK